MRKIIQVAGLAVTMAVSSVAVSGVARAQDVELRIGPDGVRPVIRDRDRDRRDMERRSAMRGCSEREARAAARASGLRDPEVIRVTPRRVVVEGDTRRGTDTITFANQRGCPEI